MTFSIEADLAPEVYPLAWLVGSWDGHGVIEYPDIPSTDFRQRIDFTHDGGPYLEYRSVITLIGPDGEDGAVWSLESGFWRVAPEVPEGIELAEFQRPLEVVITDAAGSSPYTLARSATVASTSAPTSWRARPRRPKLPAQRASTGSSKASSCGP